jgi:hypothetical protein
MSEAERGEPVVAVQVPRPPYRKVLDMPLTGRSGSRSLAAKPKCVSDNLVGLLDRDSLPAFGHAFDDARYPG